jgi:hypothetical protein
MDTGLSDSRYCPYCGSQISLDAAYCPYCGGRVTPILPMPSTEPLPSPPLIPQSVIEVQRPVGVVFLILLMVLRGVFSLFLGMIWIIAAIIYFVAVYGLWRMKAWGAWLAAVISIVGIIYDSLILFSEIILGHGFESIILSIYSPAIIVDAIALVYLYTVWRLFK